MYYTLTAIFLWTVTKQIKTLCRSRLVSLGVSRDAPQMYEQLEQKLGSGNDIANLPDMRVAHYCPYKEDLGLRLAVARLAGLTKAFDEKYVQVLLQVRNEVSRKNLTNVSLHSWSTWTPQRRPWPGCSPSILCPQQT